VGVRVVPSGAPLEAHARHQKGGNPIQ
jgi:hypothetical protein